MSNHASFASLSGAVVAASWAVLTPFDMGIVTAVGLGFVLGVLVYCLVAIADALT